MFIFINSFAINDLELLVNILKSIPTKHGTFQTERHPESQSKT